MSHRYGGLLLALIFLCSTGLPLCEAAEDPNFSDTHSEETFPVGLAELYWQDEDEQVHSGQMYYPANSSGPNTPMDNVSGPYPIFLWLVDEGEEADNYDWIGSNLASSGYIVFTLPPDWAADETADLLSDILYLRARLVWSNQNGSASEFDPENMQDSFDFNHWGVGGHGLGAIQATVVQRGMSGGLWSEFADVPPRALIGLGLENANTFVAEEYLGSASDPSLGLFLTGSADEIAEPELNIERYLDDTDEPYHYLAVSGANHVQYQDESGWWENLNDGDATMSSTVQQNHALEHILPYLDLMLKGSHDAWFNSTNREDNWQYPSDASGYVTEDLKNAQFLRVALPPGEVVSESEGDDGREVSANVRLTHRDGSQGENVTVTCEVIGHSDTSASGTFVPSSTQGPWSEASCSAPTNGVEPGNQTMRLSVNWFGMPASIDLPFHRNNVAPILMSPLPIINIPQHAEGGINFTDIALDPDGLPLDFVVHSYTSADHVGVYGLGDSSHPWDITMWHRGEPEWVGSALLNLTITDSYEPPFSMNVSIEVNVLPVDDPITMIQSIPSIDMLEDEGPRILSMGGYFLDPEAAQIVIESVTEVDGLTFSTNGGMLTIESLPNWFGYTTVEMWVSDGTTEAIPAFFDVNVASVVDPPILNLSSITMDEDTPFEIPLSTLGWDEDGEEIQFTVTGGDGNLSIMVLLDVIRIVPTADWSGISSGWNFTVESSDGTAWEIANITVNPIDDPPFVTWGDLSSIQSERVRLVFAIYDPDGELPWNVRYRWDYGNWISLESNCTTYSSSDWECEIWMPTSDLVIGSHRLDTQIEDGDEWTEERSQYLSLNQPTPPPQNPSVDSSNQDDSSPFSVWFVLIATTVVIVIIVGLYMLVALTRDEEEFHLSQEELDELDHLLD